MYMYVNMHKFKTKALILPIWFSLINKDIRNTYKLSINAEIVDRDSGNLYPIYHQLPCSDF